MDLTSFGTGGLGGLFGALLVALGFEKRLSRLEDSKVDKGSCEICSKSNTQQFTDIKERLTNIDKKQDMLIALHLENKE